VLRKTKLFWEARLRQYRRALRKPYPHLSGDLDADDDVLRKAETLARDFGRNFYITSGLRTHAEQLRLWNTAPTTGSRWHGPARAATRSAERWTSSWTGARSSTSFPRH
jgi:hypothetical protein